MTYTISYERYPERADLNKLSDEISNHAQQKKGFGPLEGFVFFIRDEKKQIVGGCSGSIFYGSLYIDQLWVQETLRHQGYGTQLMELAEKLGKQKNCPFVVVQTMDWEGLAFYQKLGYFIEFERHGYSKNSVMYLLRKEL